MPLSAAWRNAKASIADKDCGKGRLETTRPQLACSQRFRREARNPAKLVEAEQPAKNGTPSNGNGWPSSADALTQNHAQKT